MSVDLSKAKPGMIAKFRCGGQAVIDGISHHKYAMMGTSISFKDIDNSIIFENYGNVYPNQTTLLDIIALEEPPFEWGSVKPGMRFKWEENGRVCEFVGKDTKGFYVFTVPWDIDPWENLTQYSGWKFPEKEFTPYLGD